MSCVGQWDPDQGLVRLAQGRGPHVQVMGLTIGGNRYLYPEEALFLVNRAALSIADVPRDLSSSRSLTYLALETYSTLRAQGYILQRTRHYARQTQIRRYKALASAYYQSIRDGATPARAPPPPPPLDIQTDSPLHFHVWNPDRRASFKTTDPPRPDFTVIPVSASDPVPDQERMAQYRARYDGLAPVRVAVVELGAVHFFDFDDGDIPVAF